MIVQADIIDKDEAERIRSSWEATGSEFTYSIFQHRRTGKYLVVSSGGKSEGEKKVLQESIEVPER